MTAAIRTLAASGIVSLLFTLFCFTEAISALPAHPATDHRHFVCSPLDTTYHLPGCRFANQGKPQMQFDGAEMARLSGRKPCPHCLSE